MSKCYRGLQMKPRFLQLVAVFFSLGLTVDCGLWPGAELFIDC